jgi:ribosomal-protein-alanine N-acetyltransferase
MSYLKPWEPTWNIYELRKSYFVKRVRFFEKLSINDEAYSFLIFEKSELNLIGEININSIQRGVVQSCSIGYWISENKMGLGLMSEAIKLIKDFVFNELELHRIEAACLPNNKHSLKTLLKNGFEIEGKAKEFLKINGKWQDHITLGCLVNNNS